MFSKRYLSNIVRYNCNISVINWFTVMVILSTPWILMVRFFSTRALVATVMGMHPCISSRLWVKQEKKKHLKKHLDSVPTLLVVVI